MRLGATLLLLALGSVAAPAAGLDDLLDRAEQALQAGTADGRFAVRLSGSLDLEAYTLQQPPQALVYTESGALLNPRLSVFLDAQAGARTYAFVQARVDRGFDPAAGPLEGRIDEWALRFALTPDRRWSLQAGKFATVVGSWVKRHRSWDDPFVTAPIPYSTLTPMWDRVPAGSLETLRRWAHFPPSKPTYEDLEQQIPILWGPGYGTGVALLGRAERWSLDLELKNAAVSSRPAAWDSTEGLWRHPAVNARVEFRPSLMWTFGLSGSEGVYLDGAALAAKPAGAPGLSSYRQYVIGQDVGFAHHHLQVRAEWFATRFEVPGADSVDALSYYLEATYRFRPRLSAAIRWGELRYARSVDARGVRLAWGHDTWRMEVAPTVRLSAHLQLKFQYSLQHEEESAVTWNHLGAAQLTLRF